jgi:hypothetical protein
MSASITLARLAVTIVNHVPTSVVSVTSARSATSLTPVTTNETATSCLHPLSTMISQLSRKVNAPVGSTTTIGWTVASIAGWAALNAKTAQVIVPNVKTASPQREPWLVSNPIGAPPASQTGALAVSGSLSAWMVSSAPLITHACHVERTA